MPKRSNKLKFIYTGGFTKGNIYISPEDILKYFNKYNIKIS